MKRGTNYLIPKSQVSSTSIQDKMRFGIVRYFTSSNILLTQKCVETSLSNERFWRKVEEVPTKAKEGPIVFQGRELFSSLAECKRNIFLTCTKQSEFVRTSLIESDFKGTVLDLGCGLGANSIPLYSEKGCKVIAIDNLPEVIKVYSDNVRILSNRTSNKEPNIITGDIVVYEYPENVDAVIGVDILPYIAPANLKMVMEKIFNALRPGGKFVGTLFFNSAENVFLDMMGKMGSHLYPDKEFVGEIVTRSGFQMKLQHLRDDNLPFPPFCFEFVAEKPS